MSLTRSHPGAGPDRSARPCRCCLMAVHCGFSILFSALGTPARFFGVVLIPFGVAGLWVEGHLLFLSPSEEAPEQLVGAQQRVGSRRPGRLKEL